MENVEIDFKTCPNCKKQTSIPTYTYTNRVLCQRCGTFKFELFTVTTTAAMTELDIKLAKIYGGIVSEAELLPIVPSFNADFDDDFK